MKDLFTLQKNVFFGSRGLPHSRAHSSLPALSKAARIGWLFLMLHIYRQVWRDLQLCRLALNLTIKVLCECNVAEVILCLKFQRKFWSLSRWFLFLLPWEVSQQHIEGLLRGRKKQIKCYISLRIGLPLAGGFKKKKNNDMKKTFV